jgi:carbonic anhydrase
MAPAPAPPIKAGLRFGPASASLAAELGGSLLRMHELNHLFENNLNWSGKIRQRDPEFFLKLSRQQHPAYLWIGCSDSRVPANEIVGLLPGELFVHRNIANIVVHTDLNCLSVMQFAVDILKVRHIMVVGHYGCSGVQAALQGARVGLSDNWLRHVQDVRQKHQHQLAAAVSQARAADRLCELNVIEQVANVCETTIARDAWERGQPLTVHGWVYGLKDGLIHDLKTSVTNFAESPAVYEAAIAALR